MRLGGQIGRRLQIIGGFAARVPASALPALRALPFVVAVTPDATLEPHTAGYNASSDMGSMFNTTLMTGAQEYWKAGYTGQGVDIALIDSGVAPVDGLTVTGKVVNGADLSFESQAADLRYLDTYGHGTHMAGIIAGRASAATEKRYAGDKTNFLGMAPDARIVSVKVADAHGAADVSQVIAAIDWVVQHRTDNGLNIRILNLSYGTDSTQDYTVDPLAYAAEQAWKKGLVVVTATGNAGFSHQGTLTSPASDPYVLAVGATDPKETLSLEDDSVPSFSSSGDTGAGRHSRDPDVVAPGSHVVSLRVPGSYIDQTYAGSGAVTSSLFRGSGTSQAAAVVSGAAALVIQQRPSITPDQLKKLFMSNTTLLGGGAGRGRAQPGQGLERADARMGQHGCPLERHRLPRSRAGLGEAHEGRRHALGREGHLREVFRLDGDGPARGERKLLVGRHVERKLVERQLVVEGAPGRAARGAAAPGRVAPGLPTTG